MRYSSPFSGSLVSALLCAAALLPSQAHAQTPPQSAAPVAPAAIGETSKVFVLRWIKPSKFVEFIAPSVSQEGQTTAFMIVPGVKRLSPDDATKRLTVQGTPKAIKQMDEIVPLFDVEPRRLHVTARILRAPATKEMLGVLSSPVADRVLDGSLSFGDTNFRVLKDKLPKSDVVTTVTGAFTSNETLTFSAVGDGQIFRVQITPHINGDESVSVSAGFSPLATVVGNRPSEDGLTTAANGESQALKSTRTVTVRISSGAQAYLLYTPVGQNKAQGYYIEVTPSIPPRPEQP